MTQPVVIVDVRVAERLSDDLLADHRGGLVLDEIAIAPVGDGARGPLRQPDRSVGLGDQQRAAIRRDLPPSNTATIERPSALPKSSESSLQRVGTGRLLPLRSSHSRKIGFSGSEARCRYQWRETRVRSGACPEGMGKVLGA